MFIACGRILPRGNVCLTCGRLLRAAMYRRFPISLALASIFAMPLAALAQNERDESPLINVRNGLSFTKDTVFLLNLRFRMQTRAGFTTVSGEDLSAAALDMRVRRMRLRFDGYMITRKLRYYLQLNFSRADLDLDGDVVAQPLRDALVYYFFSENFYLGFGQGKLPGNRQRVISSGNQQFPDRSIANAAFTLDRDAGLFAYWTIPAGTQLFQLKGAITTGEGRNPVVGNDGLCYTGRLEWLPLGEFKNSGDFSEGDLEMEPKPRLALAAGYGYNIRARRTGGQLGAELYAPADMGTFIADMVLKWQGWALSAEAFQRDSDAPVTTSSTGAVRYVTTGLGLNAQLSKHFRSHWEIASRYTVVKPTGEVALLRPSTEESLLGVGRYFSGHRIKAQWYAGYRWNEGRMSLDQAGNAWTTMFQVEFGI
jgi:phosphate-selective porin OprO/OprP